MHRIKKQQKLILKTLLNNGDSKEIELRVICKERLGDLLVAKCKILSKDWYENFVYVTENDLYSGKIKLVP